MIASKAYNEGMTQQLRIYQLNPKLREEFYERFKTHAMPIMQSHGLKIISMWESEADGKLEFAYIIEAEDEAILLAKLNNFLADEAWIAVKNQTREKYGEMVLGKEERILNTIELDK